MDFDADGAGFHAGQGAAAEDGETHGNPEGAEGERQMLNVAPPYPLIAAKRASSNHACAGLARGRHAASYSGSQAAEVKNFTCSV